MDKRICKANDIDTNRPGGYIVDLSEGNTVNPDYWFRFATKKLAREFLSLVDGGLSPQAALHRMYGN